MIKPPAFAFVEKEMSVVPIEKDALLGPVSVEILARVAAQMGEPRPGNCRFTETALDTL